MTTRAVLEPIKTALVSGEPASDGDWPPHALISKLPLSTCQLWHTWRTRRPHQQPCTPVELGANTGLIFPHAPFAFEFCDLGSSAWAPYLLGDYREGCS